MAGKKGKELVDLSKLEEALGGDRELVLFFLAWIKHGRNATEAYLELNPHVTRTSAAVLGGKKLKNIDIHLIAESYDLGTDTYFKTLQEGLKATHFETMAIRKDGADTVFEKEEKPDYHARRKYHEALGKLLGVEGKDGPGNIAIAIKIENYKE